MAPHHHLRMRHCGVDMDKQELLLNNINVLSDSIRKKNRALRSDISEREAYLETTFKPVVGPLKEISKKLNTTDNKSMEIIPESTSGVYKKENLSTDTVNTEDESLEEHDNSEGNYNSDSILSGEEELRHTTQPSRLSVLSKDIGYKGPLTKKYVLKMLHSTQPKRNYHTYGARLTEDGLMIGDSNIIIDHMDSIKVKDNMYDGTPGLFELLFTPDPKTYTQKDLDNYKRIIKLTNAHRKRYSPNSPIHRNQSIKYKNIIKKLFPTKPTSGDGISMKNSYETNVIYYNDVNKLVNRMRLLYEAKEAGHTGVDNEIIALSDELRNRGYIM